MRFLFPFVLIILFLFRSKIKKGDRSLNDADRIFWERESKSNAVRKKDIELLHYITIPENLPPIVTDNLQIKNYLSALEQLRTKRILNLTGISNTDLKLEYGVTNLPALTEYDDNFTELARTLAGLGHLLIAEDQLKEARFFLELGISYNTDISSNYIDLASLYQASNEDSKVEALLEKAKQLHSLSKNVIIQKLQA